MSGVVMRAARRSTGVWSQVFLALATLALVLKVLTPPGFMVAAPREAGLPFPIVLCTSQGSVLVDPAQPARPLDAPAPAPAKAGHDSPCAFSGHGLAAPPPSLADAAPVAFIAYAGPAPRAFPVVAPGRGLSGPPLPARGPPSLLT